MNVGVLSDLPVACFTLAGGVMISGRIIENDGNLSTFPSEILYGVSPIPSPLESCP